jgi:lipoic acid synthetase
MAMLRPEWLKIKAPDAGKMREIKKLIDELRLHTVCESAQCPNAGECFGNRTATFMIMGDICTRNCAFCAVAHGNPSPPDPAEPDNVAEAAVQLGLRHAVITSVTRDDLPDGGARQFAAVVRALRRRLPHASVELLIPDLKGDVDALRVVADARPDVLNHNVETVPELYDKVRPQADYNRSVELFQTMKRINPAVVTKSGLMLGLGETRKQVVAVLEDLHSAGCGILTLGQYLRPSPRHIEMKCYIPPSEFDFYKKTALAIGFRAVVATPLARSSYYAREAYVKTLTGNFQQ